VPDGSLAAALQALRMDPPSNSPARPSLALAMMRQPRERPQQPASSGARPYAGTLCGYCGLEMGGECTVVAGFMVHTAGCAEQVELRERARLESTGRSLGQTPLSLQEALRATPRPQAGKGSPATFSAASSLQSALLSLPRQSAEAVGPTPTTRGSSLSATAARSRRSAAKAPTLTASGEKPRPDRPVVQVRTPREQGLTIGGSAPGDVLMRTRAAEDLSEMQMAAVRRCLDGSCDESACRFAKTKCSNCPRGLHVAECASLGTARAALGVLKCMYCRCEEMAPSREPTPSLLRTAMQSMLVHLSTGAETTAKVVADFNRLEQQFAMEKGLLDMEEALPRHNKESFINFLTWVFLDAGRARSMSGMWRSIGLVFTAQQLPNLTRDSAVKSHYEEMKRRDGTVPTPAATLTKRAFQGMVGVIIPMEEQQAIIRSRYLIQVVCEVMCGARIGEVADSGQGHGVHTKSIRLVTDTRNGDQMIDILVDGSKTGHMRYTGCVGRSASGINVANMLKDYWRVMELPTKVVQHGVYGVERADWFVVRLGLKGLNFAEWITGGKLERLLTLASGHCPMMRNHMSKSLSYAAERIEADGGGSEVKKWVNVAGGREGSPMLDRVVRVLRDAGLIASLVPGPFLIASSGGGHAKPTLLPIASSSVSSNVSKHLKLSMLWANEDPSNPDPDCSMSNEELHKAKYGSHGMRRLADTESIRYADAHGIDKKRINMRMGWKEAELAHDSQTHYEESHIKLRWESAMLSSEF